MYLCAEFKRRLKKGMVVAAAAIATSCNFIRFRWVHKFQLHEMKEGELDQLQIYS